MTHFTNWVIVICKQSIHNYTHTRGRACAHTQTRPPMHTHVHGTHMYTHTRTRTRRHMDMMHAHTYAHAHTFVHTHAPVHTHVLVLYLTPTFFTIFLMANSLPLSWPTNSSSCSTVSVAEFLTHIIIITLNLFGTYVKWLVTQYGRGLKVCTHN